MEKPQRIRPENWFHIVLVGTVSLKLILAAIVPITSEDAYFTLWAEQLDFGYYDHPPMVAWLIRLMLLLGKSELTVRLPAVFHSALIGMGIFSLLKEFDREKAALISIFFLLSPAYLCNFIITHNTPFEFFAFFSGFFFFKALRTSRLHFYALAGICLGLGLMSKYLIGFVGVAILLYFLLSTKDRRKITGFILLCICVLPFVALHFYWNYAHCWATVNFHFFSRQLEREVSLTGLALYLLALIYLASPPALYYLRKSRLFIKFNEETQYFSLFVYTFLVPIVIFLPFALYIRIGIHWLLAYFPFFFILLYFCLSETALVKSIKFTVVFALMHMIVLGGVLYAPLEWFKGSDKHHLLVYWRHKDQIIKQFEPYRDKFHLASYDYTVAAMNRFVSREYFPVFAYESHHSRQDDLVTNFKLLDGSDILIMLEEKDDADNYDLFFNRIEFREFKLHGATFHFVLGYGFNFDHYREQHLVKVLERYYMIPRFLPMKSCTFFEKYFKGDERFGPVSEELQWQGDREIFARNLPSDSIENRRMNDATPVMRYFRNIIDGGSDSLRLKRWESDTILPPGRYTAVFSLGFKNIFDSDELIRLDAIETFQKTTAVKSYRYIALDDIDENKLQDFEIEFNLQKPTSIVFRVIVLGKGEFFIEKVTVKRGPWEYHRPDFS